MEYFMQKGLPDVSGHEKETLYIIGNGFDLAHGILSKYKHFCCWLNLNGYEQYANSLQKMFPRLDSHIDCLWCNFENALETMDLPYLCKQYVPIPNDNLNEKEWNNNILLAGESVKEIILNIPVLLKDWARHIGIDVMPHFSNLSVLSKYLSFNYTLTLESVYKISLQNVCHIHGRVNGDSKLIVGFNSPKSTYNLPARSDEDEKAQALFVQSQNSLVKPTHQQIQKHREFFDSLSQIDRVIVIGHSMAHVDLRYFGEVKRLVKANAKWYFSTYSQEDVNRALSVIKPARQQPSYIENYELFDLS